MAEPFPITAADAAAEDGLICPNCGYDLRAATAERCSECGVVIDRAALRTSGFPWARRRERGRVGAYLQTVWLITVGSREIAHEASRPQDPKDARTFRRVTAALAAVGLLGPFLAVATAEAGMTFFAIEPRDFSPARSRDLWLQDMLVPWVAGVTIPMLFPLMLVGLAFALTAAHRRLFHLKEVPPWREQRAGAIADYAGAPMFWLFPAGAWGSVMFGTAVRDGSDPFLGWIFLWVLLAIALLGSVIRITQWSIRVRYAGLDRALLDIPHVLALWLWNVTLFLLILPWCVGLVWIIIDSFLA